jgi:hypothetical protein
MRFSFAFAAKKKRKLAISGFIANYGVGAVRWPLSVGGLPGPSS